MMHTCVVLKIKCPFWHSYKIGTAGLTQWRCVARGGQDGDICAHWQRCPVKDGSHAISDCKTFGSSICILAKVPPDEKPQMILPPEYRNIELEENGE